MQLLEAYGVTTVFGIPGEHSLELYRGIQASGLRAITPRNEQGASLMADGYARASGKPGVCTLTGGPGVTNAVTGIGQANADSIPLLVISSTCPGPSPRRPWERHSEILDLCEITRPITALSETVLDPEELPGLIAQAFDIFRSQRPRPVHIAIPPEVLEERVSEDWQAAPGRCRPAPAPFEIRAAADLLAKSGATLIIAGGGAQDAAAEVTALAERLNAGAVMTIAGIQLGYMLGGAIIIEQVFSLPGLGRLFLFAVYQRDFPLIQGGVVFVAFVFSFINFTVDILYSVLNPKIRIS